MRAAGVLGAKASTLECVAPALVGGGIALLFTVYLYKSLLSNPTGKDNGYPTVDRYGAMVKDGAKAFLAEEYRWLTVFVIFLGLVLFVLLPRSPPTLRGDTLQGPQRHTRRSPRGRDDARGDGPDRAARPRDRASSDKGN